MPEKRSKVVELKTKPTDRSPLDLIASINDAQKQKDSYVILDLMRKITGEEPVMWGASLIGFGTKRFKSPRTGREVDWFIIGFSPRKANLSLHLTSGFQPHSEFLEKLGKFKTGVGCVYINKLDDVDLAILEKIIRSAVSANNS